MPRPFFFLPLLLLALTLAGCGGQPAQPSPTPTALPAPPPAATPTPEPSLATGLPETRVSGDEITLFVAPDRPLQTIETVSGGNFVVQFSGAPAAVEPVSQYNLDNLHVGVARVRIGLEDWEPENDDDDPDHFNWDGFRDDGFNHATFKLMQELQNRGIRVITTVWDAPDWMVANPEDDSQRFIPYELHPEVVESILAWLLTARDQYGVEVDYVSFNEPNTGSQISLIPAELVTLIGIAGPRFEEEGLSTKWLLADVSNMDGAVSFAQSIWKNESIRPYLGPFAVHSWDADAPDEKLLGIREFAGEEGLEVWVTEGGWGPFLWTQPEIFPSWENAFNLATIYNRVLKMSGASAILYWEMMGKDYWLNDGRHPYPAFEIIRQLDEALPPGSTIVETSDNTGTLTFFAAQTPDGFMLNLVNASPEPVTVRIQGLPDGEYAHIVSTEGAVNQVGEWKMVEGGGVEVELAGSSVNILGSK